MEREFARPAWTFGQRTYEATPDGLILACSSAPRDPGNTLTLVDPRSGDMKLIPTPYCNMSDISLDAETATLAFVGYSHTAPAELVLIQLPSLTSQTSHYQPTDDDELDEEVSILHAAVSL